MEKEVIVAFVAAGAALVVAIVSTISTRSITKISNASLLEVETLKMQLQFEFELLREEIKLNHSSFQESVNNSTLVIQQVKDSILTLLYSHKKINKKEALELSHKAKNDIFEIYKKSDLKQDMVAVKAFHEAKRLAQDIEGIIINISNSDRVSVSDKDKVELEK